MNKCPKCGKSYFRVLYSECTLAYRPLIVKDGKVVDDDLRRKGVKHRCECLECGEKFNITGDLLASETSEC